MTGVRCYKIRWRLGSVEEFSNLRDAIDAQQYYMDCMCEDHAPSIIAVLNDGTEVLLK